MISDKNMDRIEEVASKIKLVFEYEDDAEISFDQSNKGDLTIYIRCSDLIMQDEITCEFYSVVRLVDSVSFSKVDDDLLITLKMKDVLT